MLACRYKKRKINVRWIYSAAFLLFMFCEIGSHSFLIGQHDHDDLTSELTTELAESHDHDLGCNIAAFCSDEFPPGHQLPDVQEQLSHHDVVVSDHYVRFIRDARETMRFAFVGSHAQYRSSAPPYYPPKHS